MAQSIIVGDDAKAAGWEIAGDLREKNRLLAGLPESERLTMDSLLESVSVSSGDLFAEAGGEIAFVHFPQTAILSLVTVLNGVGGIEALTVGREGMAGLPVPNGWFKTFARIICQVPGVTKRADARDFAGALPEMPELRRRVMLYSLLAFEVTSQSAACNRVHVTEERCARWLLMSRDRAGRDELELTHLFLSTMLGVRRPAVTVAIGILVRAGLIAHRRGRITITDRRGLEAASCECYSLIRNRELELFGGY